MMNKFMLTAVTSLLMVVAMYAEAAFPEVHGFVDVRGGGRLQDDAVEKTESLAEARMQLEVESVGDLATFMLRTDFLYDNVPEDNDLDIEQGTGSVDVREASLLMSPAGFMDVKIGRQILTWGTGDLLFINDMFPKDWQSFFVGRDEEYLKAPSDAVFLSFFPAFGNIDIAYTPRFDSDRYIRGERISYWNPMLGETGGRNAVIVPQSRDEWFGDDEIAVRVSRYIGGYESALYGYYGFWKNPEGMDQLTMKAYFPELFVYGASVRGPLGSGLMNVEVGYYDSREDNSGADPFVPNDEIRVLIGYEQELLKNFTGGLQYYVEHMQDFDAYSLGVPEGQALTDEDRHLVTLRLTQRLMNQNLMLSLFVYYSPTDEDMYARPVVSYKANDKWSLTVGANIFDGRKPYTFFGQFEDNSNIYGSVRYSF